ncbi:hypothetical protein [Haloarchaeobius amylolyticus]|uniref:hypothetical protein n=1 Tax=Haloarchaeobius amylolyticus TaxID=1198296 RepID=UPI0022712F04|nr:hypothetical protein [Haloarchaeobius amylolyticus]
MKRNFTDGTSRRTVLKAAGVGLLTLGVGSGVAAAAGRPDPSSETVQAGESPMEAYHGRRYRRGRRRYGRRRFRRYHRRGYGRRWYGRRGYYGDDVEIRIYGDPYYSGYYGGYGYGPYYGGYYGPFFVDDDEYVYYGPDGYVRVDFD